MVDWQALFEQADPEVQNAAKFGEAYFARYHKYNWDQPQIHFSIATSFISSHNDQINEHPTEFWEILEVMLAQVLEIAPLIPVTNDLPDETPAGNKRSQQVGKKMLGWIEANHEKYNMDWSSMLVFILGLLPASLTRMIEKGMMTPEYAVGWAKVSVIMALESK